MVQTIDVQIYSKKIYVTICKPELVTKRFSDYTDYDFNKHPLSDYNGLTVQVANGDVFIWFKQKPDLKLLTHECFHATEFILRFVGLELNEHTSEAYAYLLGYIISQI